MEFAESTIKLFIFYFYNHKLALVVERSVFTLQSERCRFDFRQVFFYLFIYFFFNFFLPPYNYHSLFWVFVSIYTYMVSSFLRLFE